jgi:ABC-type arginine/histidine transport system permease subunit
LGGLNWVNLGVLLVNLGVLGILVVNLVGFIGVIWWFNSKLVLNFLDLAIFYVFSNKIYHFPIKKTPIYYQKTPISYQFFTFYYEKRQVVKVYDSPCLPEAEATFAIMPEGITDVKD